MSVRIKVCGLRRREDVEACVDLGVDMLGFNCWSGSPRYVSAETLNDVLPANAEGAEVVLVFVRAEPDLVKHVVGSMHARAARVWVQLHGDEDPARFADVGASLIQVARLDANHPDLPSITAPRLLLDVRTIAFGGTGTRIDERLVERLRPSLPTEWMLAGGLNASNVKDATVRMQPWGVDVASGVETAPGVKDLEKLKAFVAAVRDAQPN